MSTPTSDLIFEVAKANVEASRAAYTSGYETGFHEGWMAAMKRAIELIEASHLKVEQPS